MIKKAPTTTTRTLTVEEIGRFTTASKDEENRKLQVKVLELESQVAQEQSASYRLKSELLRHRLLIMKKEHDEARASNLKWVADVRHKYDIKEAESFGFNPDTGEIILSNEVKQ